MRISNSTLRAVLSRKEQTNGRVLTSSFKSVRSRTGLLQSTGSETQLCCSRALSSSSLKKQGSNLHLGIGLGSDSSMIAANDRHYSTTPAVYSGMKDEYGNMTAEGETYVCGEFELESGVVLSDAQLRYQTYGTLNEERDNVMVVCHALTGNASLHAWWGELLGEGKAFDTSKYFVVCCNILGSCYGSTSATSINPATNQPYGMDFPDISVKDTVRLQLQLLKEELKVNSIKAVIGGSFGGMQAMEFAVQGGSNKYADFKASDGSPFVKSVVPIACGSHHTAWQIAISEVQRQAIYADANWKKDPIHATSGLAVARQIGMISYRTADGYQNKFGRALQEIENHDEEMLVYGSEARWQVKSYLEYQGTKFLSRFDPITYVKMTEQMDSHNVARGRGEDIPEVLSTVDIPALVMGIDSDVLYPLSEQEEMAQQLPRGELKVINSSDGHDGFLLEQEQVARHITDFLQTQK